MALPVLHEIAKDYSVALEGLAEIDDIEAINDTLEGLRGTLEAKSENVVKYTQNLEASIVAIKTAEDNMATRRKRMQKQVKEIKAYVKRVMDANQITKIETVHFVLSIKKNPPKTVIDNELEIPREYFNTKMYESINLTRVKADLKAGVEIGGCHLIQETRLDIK